MNIKRVKYKMSEDGKWENGYIIGDYDGANTTLLNEKFEYIPKIIDNGSEFTVYDVKEDFEKRMNITIDI